MNIDWNNLPKYVPDPNGQEEIQPPLYKGKRYHLLKALSGNYPRFVFRSQEKQIFKKHSSQSQKIEPADLYKERKYSPIEFLSLDTGVSNRLHNKSLSMAFTFKEYMEYALYDPEFGYYTTRPGVGTDFETTPVNNSPFYGAQLAEIIMKLWQSMVVSGTFRADEKVQILELGAGTGILARDITMHLSNRAKTLGGIWNDLFKNLEYKIGEISGELRKKQTETVRGIHSKIEVLEMDARKLNEALAEDSISGFILSNELPDAFSSHKIRKNGKGGIEAAVVFPQIADFEEFLEKCKIALLRSNFLARMRKESQVLKDCLKQEYGFYPENSEGISSGFLSKAGYKLLRRRLSPSVIDSFVSWKEFWIPAASLPEVDQFCKDHQPFIDRLKIGESVPLNTDIRLFQEGCGKILKKGLQLTIDYQYDMEELLKYGEYCFRTYPAKDEHGYKTPPGSEDITTDVNATALAIEGWKANFETVLFCSEEELLSMSSEYFPKIALHKGGPPFNALLMKKNGTSLNNPLPVLSRPVSYRELGLKLSDWSCTAISRVHYLKTGISKITRKIYETYRELGNDPDLEQYTKAREAILQSIPERRQELKKAVCHLFSKLFSSETSLFRLAEKYQTLEEFDFRAIRSYFSQKTTSDATDRYTVQMIRQLLQLYYTQTR